MGTSKYLPSAIDAVEELAADEKVKLVVAPVIQHMQRLRALMEMLQEETAARAGEQATEVIETQDALRFAIATIELGARAIEGDLVNAEPASESVN